MHKEPIEVTWKKPERGWTKLNFDGSCKGKARRSSIGGVLRDHNAEFLFCYAESIGKSTSIVAELAALRRGLELVLESGLDHVWLEGDSRTLVEIIEQQRHIKCKEALRHVGGDISLMIHDMRNCILSHVYREGNQTADKFAQLGHRLGKLEIWRENPPEVLPIMHEDAQGKIYLRKR